MANRNILMKKRNGDTWDTLYPITLDINVIDTSGVPLPQKLANTIDSLNDKIDEKHQEVTTQLAQREEDINDLRDNFEFVYDVIGFNDHTIIPTYDEDGKVSKIEEKDGQNTVATFDFTYNLDGAVDTVVQTYNGQSITYKFNYTDGEFSSITKTFNGGRT